jgi:hypothetical protein
MTLTMILALALPRKGLDQKTKMSTLFLSVPYQFSPVSSVRSINIMFKIITILVNRVIRVLKNLAKRGNERNAVAIWHILFVAWDLSCTGHQKKSPPPVTIPPLPDQKAKTKA